VRVLAFACLIEMLSYGDPVPVTVVHEPSYFAV
jgi:hypothetical protein